jgi:glycosyltransferase involved in cell wall biosynthesis
MSDLRVLYLATEFPPAQGYGLGRYAYEHSRALARAGVEVEVICNNFDGNAESYEVDGVRVHNTPYVVPFSCYDWVGDVLQKKVTLLARAAQRVRSNGGFDLLQVNDWLAASAAKVLKEVYGLPLVVTMHDTQIGKTFGQPDAGGAYVAQMERWLCELADAVTANSHFLRNELISAYGVPAGKIAVTGCGVEAASFTTGGDPELFKRLFCEPGETLVAFVGRLVMNKGPHMLLEAAGRILAVCPRTRFAFVGEGPARPDLERRTQELGLAGRVAFYGHLRGAVLSTFYHAADVVVVPSLYEPLGLVALEAMAAGTPVVASATGGLAEIVEDGHTGLLVPPNDAQALAAAVVRLQFDPHLRSCLAESGPESTRQGFTWDRVAKATCEVYRAMLSARRPEQTSIAQGALARVQ